MLKFSGQRGQNKELIMFSIHSCLCFSDEISKRASRHYLTPDYRQKAQTRRFCFPSFPSLHSLLQARRPRLGLDRLVFSICQLIRKFSQLTLTRVKENILKLFVSPVATFSDRGGHEGSRGGSQAAAWALLISKYKVES